ncbi:hypothetical protein BH11PSE3_BH11PSE3_24650 [soil metagenome]
MSGNSNTRRRSVSGSRRARVVKVRVVKARVAKARVVKARVPISAFGKDRMAGPALRKAEMQQAIEVMLAGDIATGKTILREYIKATEGFEKLSQALGTPAKSLIRMFGPRGNPQARNLFGVISYLQKRDGLSLRVTSGRKKRPLRRAA